MRPSLMKVRSSSVAKKTFPTGDPKFSVMQAFPAGLSAELADPFLMCDFFSAPSRGKMIDEDEFEVPWHPHAGFDLATYMKSGTGRHADSMGNRGTFDTPGLQWISAGSGIEHAEAGGTEAGVLVEGFQLWLNVPSHLKWENPRYGTVDRHQLPEINEDGVKGRVIAGPFKEYKGPFTTVQPVQIIDVEIEAGKSFEVSIDAGMDNCIVYVYRGSGVVNGQAVKEHAVVHVDAESPDVRLLRLEAEKGKLGAMIFAGKRLNQPIAWHGPFVATTQDEIRKLLKDYQNGNFPPVRAPWNYRSIADFPKNKE